MSPITQSLPSPENVTRTELPNGIAVLVRENAASPSVVIGGYLWAGSLSESDAQAGLSSFTAGMLMRGTDTRSFHEINDALESCGAQLGFQSGVHTVGFGGKSLSEDLSLLLATLDDCLRHAAFPVDQVERLRGQILTSLQRRAFDTRRMADLTFDALLYPDHPYGRSVQGYESSVAAISRDDLAAFYRGHYSPQGMVIAIVGAVSAQSAIEQAQATLGGWQAPGASPNLSIPPRVELSGLQRKTVAVPGKTQADLVMGWAGLARSDPAYMRANLTNTLFGVFGMYGRLGDNIREQQGLAYYCYSHLEAALGQGSWAVIAGIDPANVERTVESIRHEVRRLRDEPVPVQELADSQALLTGSMPIRLETNEGVVNVLLDMERFGLGLDYLLRYSDLVNGVTVADVQQTAREYLDPDLYTLAVAGPGA